MAPADRRVGEAAAAARRGARPAPKPADVESLQGGRSAAAVCALQQTVGNAAVARLLSARPPASPRLQRKVGFEFEDGSWEVWKIEKGNTVLPVPRQDSVHKGPGFNLEADDSAGPNDPSVEFVTKPFEETDAGLQQADATLTAIGTLWGLMAPHAGLPGPDRTEDPYPWDTAHKGRYLEGTAIGLSGGDVPASRALLSKGDAAGKIKIQVTAGVELAHLPTLMKYMGTGEATETTGEKRERKPGRRAHAQKDAQGREELDLVGAAPALAVAAITNFRGALPAKEAAKIGPGGALEGFLAAMMLTLKGLQLPLEKMIKYRLPLMARSSFGKMFDSLPKAEREVLKANHALLAQALVDASNARVLLPKTRGWDPDTGLTVGSPLIRSSTSAQVHGGPIPQVKPDALFGSLTIGEWVKGVTRGVDYLIPNKMDSYLKKHGATKAERATAKELMESFGTIGKLDKRGKAKLAVFENRAISPVPSPHVMPIADALKIAWNQIVFLKQLRDAPGAPGAYPERDVGDLGGGDDDGD